MQEKFFSSLLQLNGKIINYTFFKFSFHTLSIKEVIESVSGYCNTSSGQSGSDFTKGTDNTEKMGGMQILC